MRYFLIVNPHARGGRGAVTARRLIDAMHRQGCDTRTSFVTHFDEARTLSRQANEDGWDAIVAVGGDGTINRVLNGFYHSDGRRISRARFGVVHTGTSPDFSRSYGLPRGIEGAASVLRRGETRRIPVGMIHFDRNGDGSAAQATGSTEVSYFVCCANIGLGASLAAHANAGIRRRLGDTLGTFVSLLRILRRYAPERYELTIDGEEVAMDRVYNISVGLTPYIASGIKVDNAAYAEREQFYVMTVRALGLTNLLPMLAKIYRGRRFNDTPYLSLRGCRELRIPTRPRQADVEHDGDPCGLLPCTIRLAPDELDLIC